MTIRTKDCYDTRALIDDIAPGPNTTGLLETLFIYIFSRLAQASVQALYNLSSSPVVLGPGTEPTKILRLVLILTGKSGMQMPKSVSSV